MIIVPEYEGYTSQKLRPLYPLFDKCGFNGLINHGMLEVRGHNIPLESLGADDNGPFQRNAIYCLCKFDPVPTSPRIIQLMVKSTGSRAYVSTIKLGRYSTIGEVKFPWDASIQKDLVFYAEKDGQSIGWYNQSQNILWLTDIGNYEDSSLTNLENVLKIVDNFQRGRRPATKLTIGADPEFEILNPNGELINANTIFNDEGKSNPIGCDGHAATGEMRPAYSTNPIKLTRNIKRLIRKLNNNPNLDSSVQICAGGGTKVTTGGHLHFGIKTLPQEVKDALWDYVAAPVLKFQGQLRTGDEGKCTKGGGDVVRTQPWGVEWRPLPSFIINEEITKAVTCTSYAFVKSFFQGGLNINKSGAMERVYRELNAYHAYEDEIELFIEKFVKVVPVKGSLEKRDILKEWKQSKIDQKHTVVVVCDYPKLAELFNPLCVGLKEKIKFGIFVNNGDSFGFGMSNIPKKAATAFEAFGKKHFVPCKAVTQKAQGVNKAVNMAVYFPINWDMEKLPKEMYAELKGLIKEAIVEYNANL